MPRFLIRLTTAGLAAAAIAPATAAALTATVDKPCYSRVPTQGSEPIVTTITGGTPGANFRLTATGAGKPSGSSGSTSGTFDAAGNAVAQINDVITPSGGIGPVPGQTITLAVTDYGTGAEAVEVPVATAKVTNLSIDVSAKPRNPRRSRRVRVSGTPFAGRRLFGFVTTEKGSKVLRRFELGKANVCGFVADKAIVAPVSYEAGNYRLWINVGKTLRKKQALAYTFRIYKF
jgi:hypothetical protein